MRECKSRSGVNWQRLLNQKGVKTMGIKQVGFICLNLHINNELNWKEYIEYVYYVDI
jgi:hypothetical protein